MQQSYDRDSAGSLQLSPQKAGHLPLLRRLLLMLVMSACAMGAHAQEICNNGLDDDNDGYVDCFDIDCSGNFFCATQFFGGQVPGCQTLPPPAGAFTMAPLWLSDSLLSANTRRTSMVGDIDLDGIPEVIMSSSSIIDGLHVLNGATGALERTITSVPSANNGNTVAIGDIDNDGFGEIVFVGNNRQLYCYEHTGLLKWSSAVLVGYAAGDAAWTPALADFEEDGVPEVYFGNQIFNGANGNLIIAGGATGAKGANAGTPNEPYAVAADVLPSGLCPDCAGLELVAGNTVYAVNLSAGTMTAQMTITGFPDGLTSLADVDRDGDIDAVVVAQNPVGRGIVYAWDLQTTTQIGNTFQIDSSPTSGGAITPAGSLATVDDVDRNGNMDVVVSGTNLLLALQYNPGTNTFTELWSFALTSSNGRAGSLLFDFEGDNVTELVIRDDAQLYVFNAATGAVRTSAGCAGSASMETPTIVDVDNDGEANILCNCGKFTRAYTSTGLPWIDTRTVFNQRSYFVVNIRDNLRIPRVQQHQELGFPVGSPTNFPFNAFFKQTPFLADNGALVFPAADDAVTILNPTTDVDLGPCQDGINDSIGVRLSVSNLGDAPIPAGTLISFYNGDPYLPGAIFLRTYAMPATIAAGGSATLPMVYVADQGGSFTLFYQINDAGTNPIPITAPASGHVECTFANNLGSYTILNCGNLPPVIDTFGLSTDTIIFNSLEDQTVTYCFSASDPQFDAYDASASIGLPTVGTLAGLGDGDSCITLTPTPNTSGTTTFSIIVCDNGNVSLCDTVVFVWNVLAVNDAPIALNDSMTTLEDTPVTINVLTNDSDVENDPLTATILGQPSNGTATITSGIVTYTPNPNFSGIDTVVYILCDNALPPACDTAIVIITVVAVNDAPIAQNDSITMPNDTITVTLPVQANDSDLEAGSILTTTILCPPNQGTATVSGTDIIYIPDSTFIGLDTLCYTVCDNGVPQMCDTAYVFFNIFNGNEAPLAVDDYDSTTYLDSITFPLFTNDSDPNGHTFDLTMIGCGPQNGTLTIDTLLGIITYVPDTLFLGIDTFCYIICDNPPAGGPFCDTAFVYINVQTDNRPPVAVMDTMTLPFNTPGTLDLLANDSDPDVVDSLTLTLISQPANGSVLLSGGVVTYTPNPTFYGVDSFCYSLCDNGYTPLCDTACVYFTVLAPNELVIPNGFSPNGDGVNDFLEIEAIALFPNNVFMVFNRWGGQVFEATGYANEWDGSFNGNPLPDGTYFYTLDPGDGTDVLTGFIVLYH
jgi:gliding motility-associated-like protein